MPVRFFSDDWNTSLIEILTYSLEPFGVRGEMFEILPIVALRSAPWEEESLDIRISMPGLTVEVLREMGMVLLGAPDFGVMTHAEADVYIPRGNMCAVRTDGDAGVISLDGNPLNVARALLDEKNYALLDNHRARAYEFVQKRGGT